MLKSEDGTLVSAESTSSGFYHPKLASFGDAEDANIWGTYPCCGAMALKFTPWESIESGCTPKPLKLAKTVTNNSNNTNGGGESVHIIQGQVLGVLCACVCCATGSIARITLCGVSTITFD